MVTLGENQTRGLRQGTHIVDYSPPTVSSEIASPRDNSPDNSQEGLSNLGLGAGMTVGPTKHLSSSVEPYPADEGKRAWNDETSEKQEE
jgi:hypothetical protein